MTDQQFLLLAFFVFIVLLLFQSLNNRYPPYGPFDPYRYHRGYGHYRPPVLYDYHDHPFYRQPEHMLPDYIPYDLEDPYYRPRRSSPAGWLILMAVVLIFLFSQSQ